MHAYEPVALLAGRMLLSVIFLISGVGKLADPSGTMREIEGAGLPLPALAYAVALVCEIGGGIAVLVGFRARLAAAVLTVYTLAAALGFHTHFADPNQMIHFMKNVSIAGGFLLLVAHGAGRWSLDARLGQRTRRA